MRKLLIVLLLFISSFTNSLQPHPSKISKTNISKKTISNIDKALLTISKIRKFLIKHHKIRTTNLPVFLPFNPKDYLYISSYYGVRMHPILKKYKLHRGIDFVLPVNSEVYASANGIVKKVNYSNGYGKVIEIDHGNGITTRYGHLNKIIVRIGEKIKMGQKIGLSGNTGMSTGPHLHFEIRVKNKSIDPTKLYDCKRRDLLQIMLNFKNFKQWEQNQISFRVL